MNNKNFFWGLFGFLAFCMFFLYKAFLMYIFIALIFYVITQPLHRYFTRYISNKYLNSGLIVSTVLVLIVLPIVFIFNEIKYIADFISTNDLNSKILDVKAFIADIFTKYPIIEEKMQEYSQNKDNTNILNSAKLVAIQGLNLAEILLSFIIGLLWICLFLFVFYIVGDEIGAKIVHLIPMDTDKTNDIYSSFSNVVSIVFYSTMFSAITQGISFGIFVTFLGYDGLLLGFIYALASLIPIVGGAIIYIPFVLFIYFLGDILNAVVLLLFCVLFIGIFVDNILKTRFIRKLSEKLSVRQLNEWLVLFSIIAGISTFGPMGIFIGPTITAMFITIIRIYDKDYKQITKEIK